MRLSKIALLTVTVIGVAQAFWFHGLLPPEFGTHFDGRGVADRTGDPLGFLLVQSAMFALMLAVFLATPWLMRRLPNAYWNLPNKDYWLAPPRREAFLARFADQLAWIGVATQALLVGVFHLVLQTAVAADGRLPTMPMLVLMGAYGLFLVGWLVLVLRATRLPST